MVGNRHHPASSPSLHWATPPSGRRRSRSSLFRRSPWASSCKSGLGHRALAPPRSAGRDHRRVCPSGIVTSDYLQPGAPTAMRMPVNGRRQCEGAAVSCHGRSAAHAFRLEQVLLHHVILRPCTCWEHRLANRYLCRPKPISSAPEATIRIAQAAQRLLFVGSYPRDLGGSEREWHITADMSASRRSARPS